MREPLEKAYDRRMKGILRFKQIIFEQLLHVTLFQTGLLGPPTKFTTLNLLRVNGYRVTLEETQSLYTRPDFRATLLMSFMLLGCSNPGPMDAAPSPLA